SPRQHHRDEHHHRLHASAQPREPLLQVRHDQPLQPAEARAGRHECRPGHQPHRDHQESVESVHRHSGRGDELHARRELRAADEQGRVPDAAHLPLRGGPAVLMTTQRFRVKARPQGLAFVFALTFAAAAHADGFLYNGQSARGLGVMNACIAQADDPSAVFFTPAGLALMPKKLSFAAGASLGGNLNGHFRGDGISGEEKAASYAAPHAYVVAPLGERFAAGLGTYSMFRMRTEWNDAQHFPGRSIATRWRVEAHGFARGAAFEVTPKLGLGAGVVYRTSQLSASRSTGALSNDRQSSTGFSAGILYRPLAHWSFALTHRNEISVFPAQTNGGVAWRPTDNFVFEIDVNHTAWSHVRELVIGGAHFPLDLK